MTFYLKYRPQTFKELDLTEVREQLSSMTASGKLPHAFLFSGPRGLGKTSAARILAKAVNCLRSTVYGLQQKKRKKQKSVVGSRKASFEPCNKCGACLSITNGSALDLIEIDAASNRGIDDIRALREKIKSSPISLKKKVYVIDEVHMLTKEAFNALLKTLEEPPEHAFFILATTEPQKLPETIISRCSQVKFRKATIDELVRSLKRIVRGEKLKVEKDVLEGIGKRADGSFRDAAKVLEQLSFSGKKITKEELQNLKVSKDKHGFLKALKRKNVTQALSWIEKAVEEGIDWKDFLVEFLEDLRKALLTKFGVGESEIEEFSLEELKELIKLFSQAASELKNALVAELPIELAAIDFCEAEGNKQQATNNKKLAVGSEKSKLEACNLKLVANDVKKNQSSKQAVDLLEIQNNWNKILAVVKPQNHSVEALLRSSRPESVRGNSVIVEVFYEFHKGRLETERCRALVEAALQKVLNIKDFKVSYVLGKQLKKSQTKKEVEAGSETDGELMQDVEKIFGE